LGVNKFNGDYSLRKENILLDRMTGLLVPVIDQRSGHVIDVQYPGIIKIIQVKRIGAARWNLKEALIAGAPELALYAGSG
jgi:hypothetical protein